MPLQTTTAEPTRVFALEGGCNFRDLGGYRTRDGRELLWGKVYRTAVLSYFTAKDQPQLAQLGVRTICDLRRVDEREREPTRWPDSTTQHLNWDDGTAPPTIRNIVTAANHPNTAAGMHAAMIDLYRALPEWMAPRLHGMFTRIAQGDVPLIVHCAAGKDRTGIAIALLLAALDVPHDTIMEDYLLTNEAGDFVQFMVARQKTYQPLLTMPEDVRRVLFAAHADYLHAALEQITHDYGDIASFLRQRAGLSDAVTQQLRAALLAK